jgi:hypothetical protein
VFYDGTNIGEVRELVDRCHLSDTLEEGERGYLILRSPPGAPRIITPQSWVSATMNGYLGTHSPDSWSSLFEEAE